MASVLLHLPGNELLRHDILRYWLDRLLPERVLKWNLRYLYANLLRQC